ncbi:hypothetical protein F3K44_32675 [Bacillus megaterium]|nr:hypothetical protein [Priestia megaterium]
MNNTIQVKINKLKEAFKESRYENSEFDLYAIEDWLSQAILKNDTDTIKQINTELEADLYYESYTDEKSFILGKIHTLIELTSNLLIPQELEAHLNKLSDIEKKMLIIIEKEIEVTPSKLIINMDLSKQYVSNLLSKLKGKGLVFSKESGKYRHYSLTPFGALIIKRMSEISHLALENSDEVDFKNLITIVYGNKLKKEDKPEYIFVKNTQKTHDFSEFARRGMIERESRMEVGLFNRYS